MYPTTQEIKTLFQNHSRQYADIAFYGTNEEKRHITQEDIVQGSLTIDRYCVSGEKIEIGSAIAAELKLKLNNKDGRFNDTVFEGADLFVQIGVKDPSDIYNAPQYIPMGWFTVDQIPRKQNIISLSALDRMVLFDKQYNSTLSYPATVKQIIADACEKCNVENATDLDQLTNGDFIVQQAPSDDNLTYRQILQWCAEITGTCAYMDWMGHLRLEWYHTTDTVISESERFTSDMQENDIIITGLSVENDEKQSYQSGQNGYMLSITSNSLIQGDAEQLTANLWTQLSNNGLFSYRPYTCTVKPMPYLYPLDQITYTDHMGESHNTIITNMTFKMHGATSLAAKGKTAASEGYASANPLTKRDMVIINTLKKDLNQTLNNRIKSMLGFNDVISNALGVYCSSRPTLNGALQYYMHDQSTLEESTVIYTINEGGFAYTDLGWNGGNPIWKDGFTKDGNAFFDHLYSKGITVSDIDQDCSSKISPAGYAISFGDQEVLKIINDLVQSNISIIKYLQCGKTQLIPHELGADLIVLD